MDKFRKIRLGNKLGSLENKGNEMCSKKFSFGTNMIRSFLSISYCLSHACAVDRQVVSLKVVLDFEQRRSYFQPSEKTLTVAELLL